MDAQAEFHRQLKQLRFEAKLAEADFVSSCPDQQLREKTARAIIRDLGLRRVYQDLSKEQEACVLDKLWPLLETSEAFPLFGLGAKSRTQAANCADNE